MYSTGGDGIPALATKLNLNLKEVWMKKGARLIFALLILFSGASLVPAIGLPTHGFAWQLYATAYNVIQIFLPLVFVKG
jgi:hypothetical protein